MNIFVRVAPPVGAGTMRLLRSLGRAELEVIHVSTSCQCLGASEFDMNVAGKCDRNTIASESLLLC